MDWFERLTGFREAGYAETQAQLAVEGRHLVSKVNGQRYGIGDLELVSLQALRDRVSACKPRPGTLSVRNVSGDVRALHANSEFAGALFHVASQFNLLEMDSTFARSSAGHARESGAACFAEIAAVIRASVTTPRMHGGRRPSTGVTVLLWWGSASGCTQQVKGGTRARWAADQVPGPSSQLALVYRYGLPIDRENKCRAIDWGTACVAT